MNEADFHGTVARRVGLDSNETAREVTDATLGALGEGLSPGGPGDVATFLPEAILGRGTPAADRSADEFVGRVADRAGVDPDVARGFVRAVTAALAETVPDYGYRNVLDQLPDASGPLPGAVVPREGEGC